MGKAPRQTNFGSIEPIIYEIRGMRVVLDSSLAQIYGVTTKRFKEAFKRNLGRFQHDFAFELSREEFYNLRSQFATSKRSGRGGRHNVLDRSIEMSVYVVRAFVRLRELSLTNAVIAVILKRLSEIGQTLLIHDKALRDLYQKLLSLLKPEPITEKRRIGFSVTYKL